MIYPLTVIADRYDGYYSGGNFLAFKLEPKDVPSEPLEDSMACANFWRNNSLPIGKGSTPELAIMDLKIQLCKVDFESFKDRFVDRMNNVVIPQYVNFEIDPLMREAMREYPQWHRNTKRILNIFFENYIRYIGELIVYERKDIQSFGAIGSASMNVIDMTLMYLSKLQHSKIDFGTYKNEDLISAMEWGKKKISSKRNEMTKIAEKEGYKDIYAKAWWYKLLPQQKIYIWNKYTKA